MPPDPVCMFYWIQPHQVAPYSMAYFTDHSYICFKGSVAAFMEYVIVVQSIGY